MRTAQKILSRPNREVAAAFTLVELLVVLVVLALWAMLLLPALARTQPDSRAFQCLNNSRQLARAWRMYADDNNDKLAPNVHGATMPNYPVWALGWLDWSTSPDNTNTVYLTDPRYSALARYCGKDARVFKCPADQYVSAIQRARGWKERVRSFSENLYVGESNVESGPTDITYEHVKKWTGLVNLKPAETWLSMDEHPDSINDGGLFPPTTTSLVDIPANYHDGGAGVAYADGRGEVHHWQASVLKFPITFNYINVMTTPPDDPDLLWLRYHTPRKPGMN
jgi:prepilin-type processing-associated H-X9-DG protein